MLWSWILVAVLAGASAVPLTQTDSFIGQGTEKLACDLLKRHAAKNENMVFSPLGLNTLLAIFSEGARSDSRDEIATALNFPADQQLVREGYQKVLTRLSEKYKDNVPEMKNWFYVYKNYSVEKELTDVLREYYLTEVKVVDRPEDFLAKVKVPSGLQGKPTDHLIDVDKEVQGIVENEGASGAPHKSDGEEANSNQQPALFDPAAEKPKPETADMAKPEPQASGQPNNEEKPQLSEGEKKTLKDAETKKEIPAKNEMKEEVMVAMQRSENSIEDMSGMTDSAVKIKKHGSGAQMVVFNGLYYKGDYETQFAKRPANDDEPFYKEDNKTVFVQTLHASGAFGTAECPELKSRAIELKYVGGRYSLIVVVPEEGVSLDQLVDGLRTHPISEIYPRLSEKILHVCLPTFQITTISKPVSAAKKGGILDIQKIFTPETANLSGISDEEGLFVEELVQLVTFRVDSNYTEANFLTASIASTRSESMDTFEVNRPFLFYLRDNVDGIIVVSGKVTDPTPTEDEFTRMSLRNAVKKVVN